MMRIYKITTLLSALLLLSISLNAQHYSTKKAQVKMIVTDTICYFQAETTTALVDIVAAENSCSFVLPVKAFQLNERNKDIAFKECFSLTGFPLITFKGQMKGTEDWKDGKAGSYKLKLMGMLDIKGESIPLSENVVLLLENGKMNLAFNTSVKVGEVIVDLDCDFNLVNGRGQ
ncbi:MAG: hypothetical protein ACI9VN_001310 [Patescibacteria group bacterium]|jgi:hypothetical protein